MDRILKRLLFSIVVLLLAVSVTASAAEQGNSARTDQKKPVSAQKATGQQAVSTPKAARGNKTVPPLVQKAEAFVPDTA